MEEFDLSVYFPLPNTATEGYVTLANVLLANTPPEPPPHVVLSANLLAKVLTETQQALVARIDEDLSTGRNRSFDLFVDAVWFVLRDRLESHTIYMHEGADELTAEDRVILKWDERLARARLAARIFVRVFGDGVEFLRNPYSQQAAQMAARLSWMCKDHGIPLDEVIGSDLISLIQRCQVRYEAMVNERGARTGKSVTDIRELRGRIRRQIGSYVGALGSMVDGGDSSTQAAVEAALRPILVARANNRRKLAGTSVDELEAELGEQPAIDDITAELDEEAQAQSS